MKQNLLIILLVIFTSSQLSAQINITGQVKNTAGEAVTGASVVVKGTQQGAITDINGNFKLANVPIDATLMFSFIGMVPLEIPVNGMTVINAVMEDDVTSIEEVVVGYGTVKRANLTGAIANMTTESIRDIPSMNLSTTLQGRLTGVKVDQVTGKPGASTPITIRTSSSFGVAEIPLFVIDGVIRNQDAFDILDPSEVESISILKDASASVYGARASGGVVLVKTKNGKKGSAKINYSGSYGLGQATQFPEMLSAYDHASILNTIYDLENRNKTPREILADKRYYKPDELDSFKTMNNSWLDEIWQNAYQAKHSINISGGSDNVRYFAGGTYYNEVGNIEQLKTNKMSLRANIEGDVTKNFTATLELSADQKNTSQPYYSAETQEGVLKDFYKQLLVAPKWMPMSIDGLPVYNNIVTWNPYGLLQSGSYKAGRSNNSNIIGSAEFRFPFIKGLKWRGQYSYTLGANGGKRYSQNYNVYNFRPSGTNSHIITNQLLPSNNPVVLDNKEGIQQDAGNSKNYQFNSSLSYAHEFDKHNLNVLFVYEQSESESEDFWTRQLGASVRGYEYMWAFKKDNIENGASASESGDLGYIGRLNYNYANKYILEATFREEASTKYAPENRWGFFPAASLGWVISEENFFKDRISVINFLKLRGSAGRTGNDGTAAYQWMTSYNANMTGALFGSALTNAIEAKKNGVFNPNITWQKTNSYNLGLDLKLLDKSVEFAVDYYYRYTYDIMNNRQSTIPTTAGYSDMPDENYGQMYAKGIELELGYNGKILSDIFYNVKGSFTWDKHRKLQVFQSPAAIGRWDDQLLNDPSNQPGFIATGIIRDSSQLNAILSSYPNYTINGAAPELGMMNYKDLRGENFSEGPDGKIDNNDRSIIAEYTSPPYNYSFSFGLSWKGLKFDVMFTGEFGHKVFYNKDEFKLPTETSTNNLLSFWKDYWTPENPNAAYPRPYKWGYENDISTFWMRNGHTLRLRNMNLSYTLPEKISKQFKIPSLRVFCTGTNLWTLINPFDFKDASVSRAYDYPMIRTINFGINLTL